MNTHGTMNGLSSVNQFTPILKNLKKKVNELELKLIIVLGLLIIASIVGGVSYHITNVKYNELQNQYQQIREDYESLETTVVDTLTEMKNITSGVVEEQKKTQEKNTELEKENQELEKQVEMLSSINITDITKPSNLTVEKLDEIIERRLDEIGQDDSQLHNIADDLIKMEQETGVNALFCLSVGSLESGHGTSSAAQNKNNLFGLTGSSGLMTFSSVSECIEYWGNLINENYISSGRTTISSIQSKYCPPSEEWTTKVQYFMDLYSSYI